MEDFVDFEKSKYSSGAKFSSGAESLTGVGLREGRRRSVVSIVLVYRGAEK